MKESAGLDPKAVVEAEFGDGRASAAKVSGRCIDKKILAGAIEPGGFRDGRGLEERVPGELMYLGVPSPRVCVMMIAMSSPVWQTKPSTSRPSPIAFATSPSTVAIYVQTVSYARRRSRRRP